MVVDYRSFFGTLMKLEVDMKLMFGKLFGRAVAFLLVEPPLKQVMEKELNFGQIDCVQRCFF